MTREEVEEMVVRDHAAVVGKVVPLDAVGGRLSPDAPLVTMKFISNLDQLYAVILPMCRKALIDCVGWAFNSFDSRFDVRLLTEPKTAGTRDFISKLSRPLVTHGPEYSEIGELRNVSSFRVMFESIEEFEKAGLDYDLPTAYAPF